MIKKKEISRVLNGINMEAPKIMVLGHAGHGKDEFANIISRKFNLVSIPSSQLAFDMKNGIWGAFKAATGYDDNEKDKAYQERGNHRVLLHELIKLINYSDPTCLCRELFKKADIYTGMRSNREYQACLKKGLFSNVFWVDSSIRLSREVSKRYWKGVTSSNESDYIKNSVYESKESFNINYDSKSMILINNNGTIKDLERTVDCFASLFRKR